MGVSKAESIAAVVRRQCSWLLLLFRQGSLLLRPFRSSTPIIKREPEGRATRLVIGAKRPSNFLSRVTSGGGGAKVFYVDFLHGLDAFRCEGGFGLGLQPSLGCRFS